MDILTLLDQSQADIQMVVSNPLAMLGPGTTPLLGLQMMPERLVDENQYTETRINYKTVVANNGTRYSPVQLKEGAHVGEFDVKLVASDIGAQLTAMDYEAIIKILGRYTGSDIPMQALMNLLKWIDKSLVQPLVVKNERMVWECIVDALVQVEGDDGFQTPVAISNPAGHRIASGDWDDPTYDPMIDIYGRGDLLKEKGMRPVRQIASTGVVNKLLDHPKVKTAARGFITIDAGALVGSENRLTINGLNNFLAENELPPIVKYDKTYNVQDAPSRHYLKRDVWVMIGETDQSEEIEVQDGDPLVIERTLGYVGVGRNAGYTNPGRMIKTEAFDGKAPHIDGQSWQESFPVNQNPEAISVLTDIPI
jgi:hypothetical protein